MPSVYRRRSITRRQCAPLLFGPQRILDRTNKCAVAFEFFRQRLVRTRRAEWTIGTDQRNAGRFDLYTDGQRIPKAKSDLPPTGQFNVKLCE